MGTSPNPDSPENFSGRSSNLLALHDAARTGTRPFRIHKDDPELFAKAWRDAASHLGFLAHEPDAAPIVRRAFWGRSLEASVILVERLLPHWTWSVERDDDLDDSQPYWCELRPPLTSQRPLQDDTVRASGAAPAFAMLSALMEERLANCALRTDPD